MARPKRSVKDTVTAWALAAPIEQIEAMRDLLGMAVQLRDQCRGERLPRQKTEAAKAAGPKSSPVRREAAEETGRDK